MENDTVVFTPLCKDAICPKKQSEGAAGYDLYSISAGVVQPHTTLSISLGFSLKLPENILGVLNGRSGFALKNGINVTNSYVRNDKEVIVNLTNYSDNPFNFEKGIRIAQLFFAKIEETSFQTKNQLC